MQLKRIGIGGLLPALLMAGALLFTGCAARTGSFEEMQDMADAAEVAENVTETAAPEAEFEEDTDAPLYEKNEWDYVEDSVPDISGGIPEDAEGRLLRIRDKGVLTVATEPYFAPQEFIDPSLSGQEQYVGADMELAKRIAERMGVTLQIVPMEFSEVLAAVRNGECDLAISGLAYTPGRASAMTLSKGYYFTDEDASSVLIIREEDREKIAGIEDLAGLDLVAQSGSLQEQFLAEQQVHYHEFRRVTSLQDVYGALEEKSADASVVDMDSAHVYIEQNPDCGLMLVEQVRFALGEEAKGDRVAAPVNEEMLIAFVNAVIDEVRGDGSYDRWFEEYTAYAGRLGL